MKVGQIGQVNGSMCLEHLDLEKTHLTKILEKKIKNAKIFNEKDINDNIIPLLENFDCIIIDDFKNNIDQKILYSLLNQSKQIEKIYIN